MPRKINPGSVKSGSGKKSHNNLVLTGATGAPPNIGVPGYVPPGDTLANAQPLSQDVRFGMGGSTAGFYGHVNDPLGAHSAQAISQDDGLGPFISGNVQGALHEIGGVVPPEPPKLGQHVTYTTLSGIPDWGILKLNDANLVDRGLLVSQNNPESIFPYYYKSPTPAIDSVFDPSGSDPRTDHIWNSGLDPSVDLVGTGVGQTYAGGFTRDGSAGGAAQEVVRSNRLMIRTSNIDVTTGLPVRQEVTVSGVVYPADRGVLALIHWPNGTLGGGAPNVAAFLTQPLLDRCIAALLLGQGVNHESGSGPCVGVDPCGSVVADGAPGGIFALGTTGAQLDPYAFPGRATGQYDLDEIHNGVSSIDGSALKAPFDDLDGDMVAGAKRAQNGTTPAPGQVRLGTDPNAGGGTLAYGIPILGGTDNAYDPVPATLINGEASVGHTLAMLSNFFRYRLPYLKDYTPTTGLPYTPSGVGPTSTKEKARYFEVAQPAVATLNNQPLATLPKAGYYDGFSQDYWTWQLARYRHTFVMPSTAAAGSREDVGTYWLIHFKTEANFEAFVRDGIMPWDANDGYEVYGASLVSTSDIEAPANYVNQETSSTVAAPDGPAPAYGYTAKSYHQLRGGIILDPNAAAMPAFTASYQWASVAGADGVVWVSGVAYYTARNVVNGTVNFRFDDLSVVSNAPHGFWEATYRTDDSRLTNDTTAPALLSSPCPVFIGIAPFAYDENVGQAGNPSLDVDTGAAGAALTEAAGSRIQRIEIPFTHCGSNAGGVFGFSNGPRDADALTIGAGAAMEVLGDVEKPSFSQDAKLRAYFRRPYGHRSVAGSALPFAANDGHGIVIPPDNGDQILFHSTRFDGANFQGEFGNFCSGGAAPNLAYLGLFTASKDVDERFLDETYRWISTWHASIPAAIGASALTALTGPGLGAWGVAPIEVPVRAGRASAPWGNASWVQNDKHKAVLGSAADVEGLQVAGLPDRNPPLSDGASCPFPSRGVLIYPQTDYTVAAIRPNQVDDGLLQAQPNYSAETGIKDYVRAFDAAFSNSGDVEIVEGQPFVTLRFDGIQLSDFAYKAPGPGRLGDSAYAIMVKVPGLTTWMDAGRPDGAGPSKQDALLDGAGCQVVGPDTFNAVDSETRVVYCQVRIHVGPLANLFKNTGALGVTAGEVPVLVKVQMQETAIDYNFGKKFLNPGWGIIGAGVSSGDVRGLIGIRVVRPA